MSVYKNHKIYVLKIKVSELQFEVIFIIQNSLSQTQHLESSLSPPRNIDDLLNQPLYDEGGLRQGPLTRAMFRHLEANKESEAPVQIKILFWALRILVKIVKSRIGKFGFCK